MSNSFTKHLVGALAIAVLGVAPMRTVAAQKGLSALATRNNRDGVTPTPDRTGRSDEGSPSAAIRRFTLSPAVRRGWSENVQVSWTPISGATSFIVERGTVPEGPYADLHLTPYRSGTAQAAMDEKPVEGTPMYYRVTALKGTAVIAQSTPLPVTVLPPPHGIATSLKASAPTPGTVVLSWVPDPEAISYTIRRRKAGDDMQLIATGVKGSSYTDQNLWNGATYTYAFEVNYPDPNTLTTATVTVKVAP